MKQKRLAPILAVSLSLEMMVSPVLTYAQSNAAENVYNALQTTGQVLNTVMAAKNANSLPLNTQAETAKVMSNVKEQVDAEFNTQKLLQIPGLANYLAMNRINPAMLNCATLNTRVDQFDPEVCRLGVMQNTGKSKQQQINQMMSYHHAYNSVKTKYDNFTVESNAAGQGFGIGCMKNAMNILNGFFKYRIDELDKLTTNLEAMQNQFKEASRADLDAIEEAVAVLDGGNSELVDKVKSKNPDLFDFGKRFNNAACNSMFAGEKLNDIGKASGLNMIGRSIKDQLTKKTGKYSGDSYAQSHAAVVEDINSVVEKIGKQVELNFGTKGANPDAYADFLSKIPGSVSSSSGIQNAIKMDLFSDLQDKYTREYVKFDEERNLIQGELGAISQAALGKLGGINSATFEAEVTSIENNIKNSCLANTIGSVSKLREMIYDPSKSSDANKHSSNLLKDRIEDILQNPATSIEEKVKAIANAEKDQGNRYYMRMENSYEVQELDANGNITKKVVSANVRRSPSVYLSDAVNNCNAQFKANKLGNKLTGSQAIQKLRQLGQNFKTLAQTQSNDAKKELRKKLIECSTPEEANNTVAGSCTPDRFNTGAPGFCAAAAFSCSKNMQACSSQAEKYTKEIRDQKTARVNNYKALLEKNKKDIVKMFDSALSQYMREGELLRGMYGAGFSSPTGIQRDVDPNEKYLGSFVDATKSSLDGKLLLEDPDAYVRMFAQNIEALKKSVQDQQNQILGADSVASQKGGLLANHLEKTENNYQKVITTAKNIAQKCQAAADSIFKEDERMARKMGEDQMKMNNELGEKLPRFCKKFDKARSNPAPHCKGDMEDMVVSAIKAARMTGKTSDLDAVTEFENVCSMVSNYSEEEDSLDLYSVCTALGKDESGGYKDEMCRAAIGGDKDMEKKFNKFCIKVGVEEDGKTPLVDCISKLESQILKRYRSSIVNSGPDGQPLTIRNSAPSFCNAGDNSSRSSGKSFAENYSETFLKAYLGQ